MIKLKLAPFIIDDFERLINWSSDEKILIQFAGPIFTFPLTHVQLQAYIEHPLLKPLKVTDPQTDKVIGHCEMNFSNPNIPRISRVLIGEESDRGKGYGRALIEAIALRLFEDEKVKQSDLNVFKWNAAAISCYQKMGFVIGRVAPKVLTVEGELWEGYNMVLDRSVFAHKLNKE